MAGRRLRRQPAALGAPAHSPAILHPPGSTAPRLTCSTSTWMSLRTLEWMSLRSCWKSEGRRKPSLRARGGAGGRRGSGGGRRPPPPPARSGPRGGTDGPGGLAAAQDPQSLRRGTARGARMRPTSRGEGACARGVGGGAAARPHLSVSYILNQKSSTSSLSPRNTVLSAHANCKEPGAGRAGGAWGARPAPAPHARPPRLAPAACGRPRGPGRKQAAAACLESAAPPAAAPQSLGCHGRARAKTGKPRPTPRQPRPTPHRHTCRKLTQPRPFSSIAV
jgi:hypothetical protein